MEIDKVKTYLEVLAILIAIPVFLWQNQQKNNAEKKQFTIDYIESFRDDRSDDITNIEVWLNDRDTKELLLKSFSDSQENKNLCIFHNSISDSLDREGFMASFHSITNFYTLLAFCVEAGTCDKKLMCNFLDQNLKEHIRNFCTFHEISEIDYGKSSVIGIDKIADQCGIDTKQTPCSNFREAVEVSDMHLIYKGCSAKGGN